METLRNGRTERSREQKIGRIIAGLAGGYLILMFLVPALLPAGTIPELSGRANGFDYATEDGFGSWGNQDHGEDSDIGHDQSAHGGSFAWSELNPIAAFVYALGDLNCHQKHDRSWSINDNQMPMCTRDIGILLGFTLAALAWSYRGLNRWTTRDSFLSVFPDNSLENIYLNDRRMLAMLLICGLGLTPMGIDGFTQLLTDYESTNPIRIITGFFAGAVGGWWFSASFSSRASYFDSAGDVKLPAEAKLVLK